MQKYSTTANADGSEFGRSGAAPDLDTSLSLRESTAQAAADPVVAAGLEELAMGVGTAAEAAPKTSNNPTQVPAFTDSVTSNSQSSTPKRVLKVKCIEEMVRNSNNNMTSWKPPFDVEKGFEGSLKEIIERAELLRAPSQSVPVPTGSAPYGTTDELFARLQEAIAALTLLPAQTSSLLSYWTIATWFIDALPIAPGLGIVGPPHEGDLTLRALRNFCRYPLMMTGISIRVLMKVDWRIPPTLLCYEPNLTKQMASLLGCATTRGYMVGNDGGYKDFYGAKTFYLGEEVSIDRTPRCSVQVNVNPTTAPATQNASRLTEATIQDMQNRLLQYRLKNLVKVYNSDFDACGLTSDTRAIANALGACVIDSSKLQSELIALLTPVENQRQADRSSSLEAVMLEAILNLAHAGKAQILVGEVASEVNRIMAARVERLHYSAKTIGHRLKKIGLSTRRLGSAGRGLVMDLATMTRAHELAAVHGGVGLDQEENNLHCPLCIENK
jgi:hypothetical protein